MKSNQKLFFRRFIKKVYSGGFARSLEMTPSRFRDLFIGNSKEEAKSQELEKFKTTIWELRNYLDVLFISLNEPKDSVKRKNAEEIINYVISNNSKRIFFGSFFIGKKEISLESVSEIEEFRERYGFMFDGVFKPKAPNKKLVPKIKRKSERIAGKKTKKEVTDILKRNEFMASLKKEKKNTSGGFKYEKFNDITKKGFPEF